MNELKKPKDLLEFMDNITYGFVSIDGDKFINSNSKEWNDNWYYNGIVQDGQSVLKTKTGTCYDQVELERLWFSNNKYKFKTYFMWFYVCRENNIPTHTFLIYEDNNRFYLFEHADYANKGIYEFNSEQDALNFVANRFTDFVFNESKADINESERDTLKIYEYLKPKEDIRMYDYIYFVTENEVKIKWGSYER